MTWTQTVEQYLKSLSSSTAGQYRRALEDFAAWYRGTYGEEPEPELLTDEEAREWRGYLSGVRKLAASTVNVRLSALRGLARHAGRELETKGVAKVETPIEALTGREVGRLVAAIEGHRWGPDWLRHRNLALVALMVRAGLRVSEALALEPADVELNERSGWVTIRQGKGLKERKVPLPLQARKALEGYLEVHPAGSGPLLFVTKSGKPMSPRSVQRMVAAAAQRAGIVDKDVTPHTLRHTFATRFLRKARDLSTLKDLLGHDNIETTSRYLHPDTAQVQAMVEDL